ncbi:MAG TPA: P1 family peptidase [Ktedonobacteraceae bacterium]|jgi:L-aminopeptidase/D-esterase-like protein
MDSFGGHNLRKGIRGSSEKKDTRDVPTTSGQKKSNKRQRSEEVEETGTSTSGAPGGAGTGKRETKRVKKEEISAGTGEISTEASTSRRLEKSRATGDNGGEDGDDRRPKKRKIDNPAEIDSGTRRQLRETLQKMQQNIEKINSIRSPAENLFDSKISKQDETEVKSVTEQAMRLGRTISKQLADDNPQILQDKIDRLTNKHSPRIQAWADYLRDRYESGDTNAQRPKSTGAEEWRNVSKGRRPRDRKLIRDFAELQRRMELGLPVTAQDLYSEFGKTPYGDFRPGERDDPTDIVLSNGERVRILQINKGNAGVTLLFPKVGPNGDVRESYKWPYAAAVTCRNGTGWLPSGHTIDSLGYTWGPFAYGHSHIPGALTEGLNRFFQDNNDPTKNPRDELRWVMINGVVTAPTFKNYSQERSDITAEDIYQNLMKPIPDVSPTNGNHDAGAGDGNESFGFPSGAGFCSFIIETDKKNYTCAIITHSNYGRLRFLTMGGVHLEDAFTAEEAKNAIRKEGQEKGSINSTFITDLPLTPRQLKKLTEDISERFANGNVKIPFSHDIALAFSVADSPTLPKDPNYDNSPPALAAILKAGPVQTEQFPDSVLPILGELAVHGVDKSIYKGMLASRDIEGNGFIGKRMSPEKLANLHYFVGRFRPDLKPIREDQIPGDIDPDVAMREVSIEDFSDHYSEASGDESDWYRFA